MHDPVNAGESTVGEGDVADVADEQLDRAGEVGVDSVVDLLLQRVEDDDVVAAGKQLADDV
jgi:hypothetical protein